MEPTKNPRRRWPAAVAAVALALAAAAAADDGEEFRYRWRLANFAGRVAGLFLPTTGEGQLTFTPHDGRLTTELLITSERSRDGEFWRYGSEVDAASLDSRRAWSSYRWRGESKSKSAEIDAHGVKDVVAGIYAIRRDPPAAPRPMAIWSDGKTYPVVVIPRGVEPRRVAGRVVVARRFSIRGVDVAGGRRWKGKLELWLTDDAAAAPVELHISRSLADLRLELVELP
jgi:hypothetical protein